MKVTHLKCKIWGSSFGRIRTTKTPWKGWGWLEIAIIWIDLQAQWIRVSLKWKTVTRPLPDCCPNIKVKPTNRRSFCISWITFSTGRVSSGRLRKGFITFHSNRRCRLRLSFRVSPSMSLLVAAGNSWGTRYMSRLKHQPNIHLISVPTLCKKHSNMKIIETLDQRNVFFSQNHPRKTGPKIFKHLPIQLPHPFPLPLTWPNSLVA